MTEVEIHAEHAHPGDAFGRGVGISVGIIGVLLSAVTILGHREHTAAILRRTEANDDWSYYQAKKIREHEQEIAATLLASLASDPARVSGAGAKFSHETERYEHEAEDLQRQAERSEAASVRAEARALRFDLGEGLLELGMVMSSLYFLARRRFFVAFGATAALAGTIAGVLGLLA